MKPLLATLALAFVAAFATPTPAAALNFEEIKVAGVSVPIHGVSRARRGAPSEGCRQQLTFEVLDENAGYRLEDVLVSSYNEVSFRVRLRNGAYGTVRLFGVTVLNFGPAAVDGQKGWSGTLCYERQVLEFNGQDFE